MGADAAEAEVQDGAPRGGAGEEPGPGWGLGFTPWTVSAGGRGGREVAPGSSVPVAAVVLGVQRQGPDGDAQLVPAAGGPRRRPRGSRLHAARGCGPGPQARPATHDPQRRLFSLRILLC